MRAIEFRAWHKGLKKMLYPPYNIDSMTLCRPHTDIDIDGDKVSLEAHMTWDGRWYIKGRHQDVVWMQYTGLKDKTGREIYEGDIVQFKSNARGIVKDVVEWNGEYAGFNPFCIGGYYQQKSYIEMFGNKLEVIGNIYENPELLEDDNERAKV